MLQKFIKNVDLFFQSLKTEITRNRKPKPKPKTDGARAMTGKNIGFKSFFQAVHYDHITFSHCLIHQEAAAKKQHQN